MKGTGYIIFAHGSTVASANEGVRSMTAALRVEAGLDLVETAFLECAQPDLAAAARTLVERGAQRVYVVPFFLTLGIHLQRDLPRIVDELSRIHKDVSFTVLAPMEGHPLLRAVLRERIEEAREAV